MSRIYGEAFATIPESLLDADVSSRAIHLWCILSRLASNEGRAFPSRRVLAERLGCSANSVDRAIAELVDTEFVVLEASYRGDGSRTSNSYWLWPRVPTGAASGPHPRVDPSPSVGRGAPTGGEAEGNESQSSESQGIETTPSRDPLAGFDAFWSAYPRNTAKGTARAAWPAAVKAAGGEPSVIVAGAERFAVDPNRVAEFTPHPATWLRGERWADGPLPARGRPNGKPPARSIINNVDTDRDAPGGRIDVTDL